MYSRSNISTSCPLASLNGRSVRIPSAGAASSISASSMLRLLPRESRHARSMVLRSSRTLPGHEWRWMRLISSGEMSRSRLAENCAMK